MPKETPFEPTDELVVIVPVPESVTVSEPTTFVKLLKSDPLTDRLPS